MSRIKALILVVALFLGFIMTCHAELVRSRPSMSDYDKINMDEVENNLTCTKLCDDLEPFNRAMFTFNDYLDRFIIRPIAELYNQIIPHPLNRGIHNIFLNLNTIPTIANDILQLQFYQLNNDVWRLAINSTLGIGGLFDVATWMGLEPYANDFGLTLAYYGWEDSRYLVLPFFGPNTFRDGFEIPVDYYYFSVYPYIDRPSLRYQLLGLAIIDRRAQLLKFQCVMDEAALDPYLFLRNAYLQRRCYQIEKNRCRGFSGQVSSKYTPEVLHPASSIVYARNNRLVPAPGYLRIGI